MPATSTPNLQLAKPDPNDLVNVLTDLDANYDKIDTAVGPQGVGGRGCEYNNNLGTTLPIANDVHLEFNVVTRPSGLIVASGANNRTFTVQATGWFDLGAGIAQGGNFNTGVYLYIALAAVPPGGPLPAGPLVGTNNIAKLFPVYSVGRRVYLTNGQAVSVGASIDTNTYPLDTTRRNYFTAVFLGL